MTVFNRSTDLPSAIDRLVELFLWAALTLYNLYSSKTYQEQQGAFLEREIDITVTKTADGKTRAIVRASIELDDSYVTGTAKLWTYAVDMGTASIPNAYKVD